MFTRRKILILLGCGLATIATLVFVLHDEPEPSYQGRSLSEWIVCNGIGPDDIEVTNAVNHIGTNAIPWLLKWIRFEPPQWHQKMHNLPNWFWEGTPNFIAVRIYRPYENSSRALAGFSYLGTNGAAAIPELIRIMNDSNSPTLAPSSYAVFALSPLGKAAFPPLLQALANPDPRLRSYAIEAIGLMGYLGTNVNPAIPLLIQYVQDKHLSISRMAITSLGRLHLEPELAVPALTKCLASTNGQDLRRSAVLALGNFGDKAKSAIPAVVQLLTDAELRANATNAIMKIAPEILTNTVPQ